MSTTRKKLCCLAVILACVEASGRNRHGSMTVQLDEKVPVNVLADEKHHSILIELPKTRSTRLEALQNYDENLIRRLIIKDLGPEGGTSARIDLKDARLRANVTTVEEPFSIVISIFDYDYKESLDPTTGLPLISESMAETKKGSDTDYRETYLIEDPINEPASPVYRAKSPEEFAKSFEYEAKGSKLKLLKPTPNQIFDQQEEVKRILAEAKAGRGPAWEGYPIYIYPILLAPYEGRENSAGWKKNQLASSLNKGEELAQEALKLFLFGDESRSLLVYQKVLHLDRTVFDKDPIHLWALSEAEFGENNLLLADGYFEALITKFPESDLSYFARLRRIDIKALEALKQNKASELAGLAEEMEGLADKKGLDEYRAQKLLRKAYWKNSESIKDNLPYVDPALRERLLEVQPNAESQKTSFLLASLILRSYLIDAEPWTKRTADFAGAYFKTYSKESAKPYYKPLYDEVIMRLSAHLKELAFSNKSIEAVESFESLSPSLKKVTDDPQIAWSIAESYRLLAMNEKAFGHYKNAASGFGESIEKFKATFWTSVLAVRLSELVDKDDIKNQNKAKSLKDTALAYDKKMGQLYRLLSQDDKEKLKASYQAYFEETLKDQTLISTPADIILATWTDALNTPIAVTADKANPQSMFSPSANAIRLLKALATRFFDLGKMEKKRASINLMRKIDIKGLSDDKEAQRIWATELLGLAEEYREMNQYLDAGRLYTFTAEHSVDWELRAESLYKGGLLLYRAGKREEAISALTEASQDGNNMFYATLAKERLNQLTKK